MWKDSIYKYVEGIEVIEMKKRFYEEPEIELRIFSLTNIITSSPDDDLDIDDVIPGAGNGSDSGSGGDNGDAGNFSWPY